MDKQVKRQAPGRRSVRNKSQREGDEIPEEEPPGQAET